jgi:hypothetical protein
LSGQYQTFRSVGDLHVFVLCLDGTFYEHVPDDVRRLGPGQGTHPRHDRGSEARVPPSARARRLRAGEVRGRGVQSGGSSVQLDLDDWIGDLGKEIVDNVNVAVQGRQKLLEATVHIDQ